MIFIKGHRTTNGCEGWNFKHGVGTSNHPNVNKCVRQFQDYETMSIINFNKANLTDPKKNKVAYF
jgi:hypothetical protein